MEKTVKVLSSVGKGRTNVTTKATTWGDLQRDLSINEVSFSGMNITIGETRTQILNDQSVLPEGDFTLFLTPKKTKSGATPNPDAMSYGEVREAIKNIISEDSSKGEFFNRNKNYTNKSASALRELLSDFYLEDGTYVEEVEEEVEEEVDNSEDIAQLEIAVVALGKISKENKEFFSIENIIKDLVEIKSDLSDEENSEIVKEKSIKLLTEEESNELDDIANLY